ncbi:MAG TPA: hypothetical protein VMS43_10725 [Allosphingosinicella sp.]|nr:hypothetical protein [Allosphingosinicella sp.]
MIGDPPEVALEQLGFWPEAALAKLRAAWITSTDQLIGLAATEGGVAAIARTTGLEPERVEALLARTRASLPASRLTMLETPVDTSQYGLGAEDPAKRT